MSNNGSQSTFRGNLWGQSFIWFHIVYVVTWTLRKWRVHYMRNMEYASCKEGSMERPLRCGETWQPSLNQRVKINILLQQKSAILLRSHRVLISVLPHDSDIKQIAVGTHFYLISDHDSLRLARSRNCHPGSLQKQQKAKCGVPEQRKKVTWNLTLP